MDLNIREFMLIYKKRIKKKYNELKHNSAFFKYLPYAFISLILGILPKIKIWDETFILANSFINTSINISGLNEYILILNKNDYSPLFSTSAAVLSTIFALIFVLSTLYVQLLNKFTSLNIFFTKETKLLMITYFGTIILSLVMLETNYQCPTFILIMTVFCVLSIYPFMQNINLKLIHSGINKLSTEIKISINANEELRAISIIEDFKELHKSIASFDEKNNSFPMAMIYCDNICMFAKNQQMRDVVSRMGYHYFDIMSILIGSNLELEQINIRIKLVLSNIENYTRNYSEIINYAELQGQVSFLNTYGTNLIKKGFEDSSVKIIIDCLYNSFNITQEKRSIGELKKRDIGELEDEIIEYIGELTRESIDKKLKLTVNIAIMYLWKIGADVIYANEKNKRDNSRILYTIINQLKEIKDITNDLFFEDVFTNSKLQLSFDNQEIEPYLDKFKKYYSDGAYTTPLILEVPKD